MLKLRKKKSSKVGKKLSHPKIYNDIDVIPIDNWEQIVQHGRLEYFVVQPHRRRAILNPQLIQDAYDTITDQYFSRMGINPQDDEFFILLQKRIEWRNKFINGDKSAMNFIRLITAQLHALKVDHVKPNMQKNRLAVEKWYGTIDKYTKTVGEFIDIVKLMEEEANAISARQTKSEE